MSQRASLESWVAETLLRELAQVRYGSVTLRVHDGIVVSVDTVNERRIGKGLVKPPERGVGSG